MNNVHPFIGDMAQWLSAIYDFFKTHPFIGNIAQWLSAIASLIALYIAGRQLSHLIKTNSIKMVLDIEKELQDKDFSIRGIAIEILRNDKEDKEEVLKILSYNYKAAKDNYFNVLDRLCYCILDNYLQNRKWKKEYQLLIFDTIKSNPNIFNSETRYTNIKELNKKWLKETFTVMYFLRNLYINIKKLHDKWFKGRNYNMKNKEQINLQEKPLEENPEAKIPTDLVQPVASSQKQKPVEKSPSYPPQKTMEQCSVNFSLNDEGHKNQIDNYKILIDLLKHQDSCKWHDKMYRKWQIKVYHPEMSNNPFKKLNEGVKINEEVEYAT